ncbi:cytochrome P450 [Pseudomonas sp. FP597]|uniref:cytochrome P450 n=1 Tax=Pseudomonas sp. FP597 TaxID=2954096 RepID=UPI00112F3152|nr:cytochrome P450 [Pseudomonas sp. FP597]WLI08505.1 cytochrome P450 [Pseudomonas sp. FP597]
MTPLEAVTHADPYKYYSRLRLGPGLLFDTTLGLWVASSAQSVEAVLMHPDCRVRPLHEPVPPAIAQGAAGQVFARLMRMNEGAAHRCPRAAIEPALCAVEVPSIVEAVGQVIEHLGDLDSLMFSLPVSVVASLLGLPTEQLDTVARLTREFVACLSPLSDEVQLRHADTAASRLNTIFTEVLQDATLLAHIHRGQWEDTGVLTANLIGLLSQTCEATAGLIGNTLVTLIRQPELIEQVRQRPALAMALVEEVARYDSPVQNTRRFVVRRCTIGCTVLEAGDIVLVLLASANRDPGANPKPDSFMLKRLQRRIFSFGAGHHRCPGQQLALSIASQAVLAMLRRQPSWLDSVVEYSYWPSLNSRIPRFQTAVLSQ